MDSPKQRLTASKAKRPWRWDLILALLGAVLFCLGFVFVIVGEDGAFGLVFLGICIWLATFMYKFIWRNYMNEMAEISMAKLLEEEELERIKKTMTPGEWELYKVQRENQKLLKQMNAKHSQSSRPKPMFGIVNDLSD